MNTPKKTLVAELTAALGPLLHAPPGTADAVPKPVEKAIEQLAATVLRWRSRQDASTASRHARRDLSDSDELAQLMSHHPADEVPPAVTAILPTTLATIPPPIPGEPAELATLRKPRRPRI